MNENTSESDGHPPSSQSITGECLTVDKYQNEPLERFSRRRAQKDICARNHHPKVQPKNNPFIHYQATNHESPDLILSLFDKFRSTYSNMTETSHSAEIMVC